MIAPASPKEEAQDDSPVEAVPNLDYVSPSSLKSFLTCRLRFYYEKVLQIKTPTNPKAHLGKVVHESLKFLHRKKWTQEEVGIDELTDIFYSVYSMMEEDEQVAYSDASERPKLVETGSRVLQAYLESELYQKMGKPNAVEVRVEADNDNLALPLLGYVDLVREGNIVTDFKTIAATPNVTIEGWLHELQLTAYQIMVEEATGEPSSGSELVFLVKTKTPKVISHTFPPAAKQQRERFFKLVEVYREGLETSDYYPSPGQHCSWCSHRGNARSGLGKFKHNYSFKKNNGSKYMIKIAQITAIAFICLIVGGVATDLAKDFTTTPDVREVIPAASNQIVERYVAPMYSAASHDDVSLVRMMSPFMVLSIAMLVLAIAWAARVLLRAFEGVRGRFEHEMGY